MASAPHTYQKGKMDLSEHQATFALFWWWTKVSIIGLTVLLALMAYFLT